MPEGGGGEEKGSRRTCLTTMRRTKGEETKEGRHRKRKSLGERKKKNSWGERKEGREREGRKGIRVFSF